MMLESNTDGHSHVLTNTVISGFLGLIDGFIRTFLTFRHVCDSDRDSEHVVFAINVRLDCT